MDAVTYPKPAVIRYISENLIPLRVPHDHKPLAERFQVKWTPTLVTVDAEGNEHHRTVGFLEPEELVASLMLGRAKSAFDLDDHVAALEHLDAIIRDHSASAAAPEAIFLQGVSRYKHTHEARPLKEAYETLKARYPNSEWTMRAHPYSLL
jgi:hypothetical protein